MSDSLLTILKFLLVALIYLFFFRVLRAVWAEVQTRSAEPPAPSSRAAPGGRAPRRRDGATWLRIVEPKAQKGHSFQLGEEVTVGRATGCKVRLDDTFASQLHARIFQRDGQYHVEDLGSKNGTFVRRKGTTGREKVTAPMVIRPGDRLIVGETVMELTR